MERSIDEDGKGEEGIGRWAQEPEKEWLVWSTGSQVMRALRLEAWPRWSVGIRPWRWGPGFDLYFSNVRITRDSFMISFHGEGKSWLERGQGNMEVRKSETVMTPFLSVLSTNSFFNPYSIISSLPFLDSKYDPKIKYVRIFWSIC